MKAEYITVLQFRKGQMCMMRSFVKRKVRKSIAITLTLLLAIASAPLGAIDAAATVPDQNKKQDAPTFSNVSVHDPSIVKDGDTYYVFGSHISAAKSKDLTNWTSLQTVTPRLETHFTGIYRRIWPDLSLGRVRMMRIVREDSRYGRPMYFGMSIMSMRMGQKGHI